MSIYLISDTYRSVGNFSQFIHLKNDFNIQKKNVSLKTIYSTKQDFVYPYNFQMEFLMLDHCEFGSFGFFLIFRQHLPRDFSFQYEQIEWFFTTTIT